MDIPRELIEQLDKGNVMLFCGAGISISDGGIPSGEQLAKELAQRAELGDVTSMTLPEVAQAYEIEMGHHSLIAFITDRIESASRTPLRTHQLIAALPFQIIITTNWDTLLEDAMRQVGNPIAKIVRDEEVAYVDHERILIKLHGSVDQKGTIVITGDDYYNIFARLPATTNLVHGFFATKTALFLGYGLADEDFKRIYHEVERHLGKHKRRAYAVQLNPTELEVKHWQQKNMQVIKADAVTFLEALARRLDATNPSAPASTRRAPTNKENVAYSAQYPPFSAPSTSEVASQTISTPKGQFRIPGTAYMDGRDEEASPPLTLMSINIWSGVPRQQVACKLPHGKRVDVINVQYSDSEGRYYFRVQSGSCEGWVSEPFLSPSFAEPTGDRIP